MRNVEAIVNLYDLSLGENEVAFIYLGYSAVIVRTAKQTIVIDPAGLLDDDEIKALRGVDLLLFTHGHGDHYVSDVATNIVNETGTPVLAEPQVAIDLSGKIAPEKITSTAPGQTYTFDNIIVNTVEGIHRGPITLFQIKIGDLTIFHGGDSGYVPVKNYPADLAFLPTGSPSPTASPEYAFKMAAEIKPKVVVAIHGSEGQSSEFEKKVKENLPQTSVVIPETYTLKRVTL